jgi:formamidopyrimidine-DNA glycosylase
MDQQLMAGIGNVYSDEILFQVGVHPRTQVKHLNEKTREKNFHAMQDVLRTAIELQAKPERFPDTYIIPHRNEGDKCPRCVGKVKRVKVAGRSAYYCPCRQKVDSKGSKSEY